MAVANTNIPIPSRPLKAAPALASHKHSITPPKSDRADRTSFSSVKENTAGIVQSFTDNKISSYLRYEVDGNETAIDEGDSGGSLTPPGTDAVDYQRMGPLTNPHSALHGFVCPCEGFRGWKQIVVRGKIASKSYGDLKSLGMGWGWDSREESKVDSQSQLSTDKATVKDDASIPGKSPIETLPTELLGKLFPFMRHLTTWIIENSFSPPFQFGRTGSGISTLRILVNEVVT
jgi:hypothetical protein